MNEQDERQTGAALGRAVETQSVRETPFERSRLAAEIAHPRGSGFPLFRVAAAFAVLVLAVGALYVASLRAQPGPTTTPTPAPSGSAPVVVPTPTTAPVPSGTPLPGRLDHSVVYCGRAGAPPFAIGVPVITGGTPEQRITQRLQALEKLQPLGPTQNGPCPMGFPSTARVTSVTVSGDLATVEYAVAGGDWGYLATTPNAPLVQEIAYTASEEPGIRRVKITQDGGAPARVAPRSYPADVHPVVLSDPLTREDVLGYGLKADASFSIDGSTGGAATTRWSVDQVAPGLARFVIELPGSNNEPKLTVTAARNDEAAQPDLGKWSLFIEVAGATHTPGSEIVDKTPLRSIQTVTMGGTAARYLLGLDDLRPWRVALIPGDTTRIVVDIGGPTAWVTQNLAVYAADVSGHTIHVTGAARAFEAHVAWRIKAGAAKVAQGSTLASIGTSAYFGTVDAQVDVPANVRGDATLELFLVNGKGDETDVVSVPIRLP